MVTTPLLTYLGLCIHPDHLVAICVACGVAKLPQDIRGHVVRHKSSVTPSEMAMLNSLLTQYGVVNDPAKVRFPGRGVPPVELLPVVPDAYCCNACPWCFTTLESFKTHWYKNHTELPNDPSDRFHLGSAQTFFEGYGKRYFEVSSLPQGSPSLLKLFWFHHSGPAPSINPTKPAESRELPPLLVITRWLDYLERYVGPGTELYRRGLRSLVTVDDKRDHRLREGVDVLLSHGQELARSAPLAVRYLLVECPR